MITFHHKDPDNKFVHGEITVTNDAVSCDAAVESFITFLIAIGFHPKSVKSSLESAMEDTDADEGDS